MLEIPKTLIAVPTYNERENLEPLVRRILKLPVEAALLIVDDRSPDGTGEIADRLAAEDPAIQVIHRPGKLGIGGAHLEIIRRAYALGVTYLITMDCDFTHQPEDIPQFIERSEGIDLVIGTRFVDPRSLKDWEPFRKMVTHLGHFLTQRLLGMPYDASGAFRLYRLDRIPAAVFDLVTARGYAFFFQSLYILWLNGFSVREIPILLPVRTCGHSKMTAYDAAKGLWRLAVTCVDSRTRRSGYLLSKEKRTISADAQPFTAKND